MTALPGQTAGLTGDTRRAHAAARDALRDAVGRTAELWRRVPDPGAAVPGLTWTAAETAAHLLGDLHDYAEALTRYANGYITHADRRDGSPSQLSAIVNARHLAQAPERDLHRLADMLEERVSAYLAVAAAVDASAAIPTPNGLVLDPPTMTCLLLGEQLVHGLDVARAARLPWPISARDALLVIPGVLSIAPYYLRPQRAGNLSRSYELRMRGGSRYRLAVHNGTASIGVPGAKTDCVISADPVAFLLLGYGRSPQWSQIIRGKLSAGGRKPWLAMSFGTLLASP
jgi:hypothetical protein